MANPKLRFKEFIEPWETKPLNSVFSLFSGFAFPSSASCDSGVRWLKISDVGIQTMVCSNPSYLPYELKEKYPEFIVNKDEYVIALTRPILNKQLKLAKVGEIYDGALLNQRVAKLISKSSNVDFVYSLLQKSDIIELLANSIAGSDPPNLSLSEIKNINLTIPRIEEQTKIANFLTAVDKKISQLNEQHQLMIQYKKGVMQKIFSQEIRFKDDNGEEFGEWIDKTLSDVGEIITGKTPSTQNPGLWEGNILFITPTDLNNRKIQMKTERTVSGKGMKILPINTIVFTCIASIGKMAITGRASITNQQINSIIVKKDNFQFIYYALLNIVDFIKSTQSTTTMPIINKTEFSKFVIKVPCVREQTKIANFLSIIDDKIENLELQLEQVRNWKKGLLQQIFI